MAVTTNTSAPQDAPAVAADERSRDRSPSFPFISLEDAVARATAFEAIHHRHAARIPVVADAWKISAKSSTMAQTVAALKAYGLLKDGGAGSDRKVELTELAQRILKDNRPGNRDAAVKEAALKPRTFASHFRKWGVARPPDATCLSDLHLDEKFTEEAAVRFLRVYDATIVYAGLSDADKPAEESGEEGEQLPPPPNDSGRAAGVFATQQAAIAAARARAGMAGAGGAQVHTERVVFSQEIETPEHLLKVLVSGPVDEALLDALEDFVGFQRKRLERRAKTAGDTSGGETTN